MSEAPRQPLQRYLLCYAIWIGLCVLIGFVLTEIVDLLIELSLALRLNPWQGRAVRQLSLPILGVIWLGLIFWLEHDLRTNLARNRLFERARRSLIPILLALGGVWALRLVI
ncbi:MAG: hypothetical protein Fur005_19120 [Roseiflexaceae bacterium]